MKRYKKITAVIGEYEKDGQKKKRYAQIGTLLVRDDGSYAIKLDTLPVNWDGWGSCWDFDEEKKQAYQEGVQQAKQAAQPTGGDFDDSDFPF